MTVFYLLDFTFSEDGDSSLFEAFDVSCFLFPAFSEEGGEGLSATFALLIADL